MRCWFMMAMGSLMTFMLAGCSGKPEALGLARSERFEADRVRLLVDETWVDADGRRHVKQEIFDQIFSVIDEAERFILIDMFLVNEFLFEPDPCMRPLSAELKERLLAKRAADPGVEIIFITDPINTVYGSVDSALFNELSTAGVKVVWTRLDRLRDSNPLYSKPWRLLVKPWGTGPGDTVANPMGEGRISLRSLLKLLNFKANHRKLVVTEKSLIITSANPHDASSAHWNTALRVDSAGAAEAVRAEAAVLDLSGSGEMAGALKEKVTAIHAMQDDVLSRPSAYQLNLLTERRIKDQVLKLLEEAGSGTRIDLTMFYLSDRDIIRGLISAKKRGCDLRIILDPNKDAFGRIKNGIPNRQSAFRLVRAGIPLRWADTHGEQCHVKMLYVEQNGGTAALLLGSGNFTRRNLDNYNIECSISVKADVNDANMRRVRETFDRWWNNTETGFFTTDYSAYEDTSRLRRIKAWWMEISGMSTF